MNRVKYIDIYRGIGIVLMVMGHIGFGNTFSILIHSFNMPMFFFVSGYFYKKPDNINHWLKKKYRTLLIPYAIVAVIQCIVAYIALGEHTFFYNLFSYITVNTNTMDRLIGATTWFLVALFIAEFIFMCIDVFLYNWKIKILIYLIIVFAGHAFSLMNVELPFCLNASFISVGFILIGHLMKTNPKILQIDLTLKGIMSIMGFLIVAVILTIINGEINMRTNEYSIIPLFWINSLLWIIIIWNFSRLIEVYFTKGLFRLTSNSLMQIGKNSIVFLCTNKMVILLFDRLLTRLNLPKIFEHCLILFLSLILMYFLNYIVERTKLKYLFGMQRSESLNDNNL